MVVVRRGGGRCSSRLTARLRAELAEAIAGANRVVAEVAAAFGVAWRTVHTALVSAAARWLHLEQTGA